MCPAGQGRALPGSGPAVDQNRARYPEWSGPAAGWARWKMSQCRPGGSDGPASRWEGAETGGPVAILAAAPLRQSPLIAPAQAGGCRTFPRARPWEPVFGPVGSRGVRIAVLSALAHGRRCPVVEVIAAQITGIISTISRRGIPREGRWVVLLVREGSPVDVRIVSRPWISPACPIGWCCYPCLAPGRPARSSGDRRRERAFRATIIVDALIRRAPTAGGSRMPQRAATPAASGIAMKL